MRHLGSLLVGLLTVPVTWLLLAIGQPQTASLMTRWVTHEGFETARLIGPTACLVIAGLVVGLLTGLRASPVGAIAACVVYALICVALFINPLHVIDAIPDRIDLGLVVARPRAPVYNGTLPLLAILLVVVLANRARWQGPELGVPDQASDVPQGPPARPEPPIQLPPAVPAMHPPMEPPARRPNLVAPFAVAAKASRRAPAAPQPAPASSAPDRERTDDIVPFPEPEPEVLVLSEPEPETLRLNEPGPGTAAGNQPASRDQSPAEDQPTDQRQTSAAADPPSAPPLPKRRPKRRPSASPPPWPPPPEASTTPLPTEASSASEPLAGHGSDGDKV